jgi:hypothetical protein
MHLKKMEFEIEYISKIRDGYLFARLLQKGVDFTVTDNSTLGGYPVKKSLTMPRALDKDGNPRFDLFAFQMKSKSDLKNLNKGQIIELAP